MNWHHVIQLFFFVSLFSKGILFTNNGKPKTIFKCCPKGMQFDGEVSSCVTVHGWNVSDIKTETFYPPIDTDTNYWIHPNLSVLTLIATYGNLSEYELDVSSINFLQNLVFKPRDYSGEIPEKLIRKQIYCYDRMPNTEHPYVQFESTVLNPIYKCCAKGERLNAQANGCEQISNLTLQEVEEEVVGLPRDSEYFQWLPANTSELILKLKYNILKSDFVFNTVVFDNADFVWDVVKTESDRHTGISFRGRNEIGVVAGETDIFCFDEVSHGPITTRVLLAGVYDVNQVYKCCGKGEELGDIKLVCVPRSEEKEQKIKNDIVEWRNNSRDAYWMPDSLQYGDIAVQYDMIFKMSFHSDPKGWIFDENLWQLKPGKGLQLPRILYNMTDISGNTVKINTPFFCFDSIKDSAKKVTIMHIKTPIDFIRKCCLPGEILSPSGLCEKHDGEDWSPVTSSVKSMFNDYIPKDNVIIPLKWFCSWLFNVYPLNGSRAISHYQGRHLQKEERVTAIFCNDFQRTDEGLKEVAATCEDPPYIRIYEKFILLDGVAAGLLLVAAVVAATRKEMRRSAHGCALACHAICLAVVHSIQIFSFLSFSSVYNPCTTNMVLTTYFFMVAAHWWLSVITFSMFYNFRQPLGALAHKDGGAASMWVRFAIMSSVAWSGSAALTTLAGFMNHYNVKMMLLGIITPNFLETRTCVFDNIYYGDEEGLHSTPVNNPYGSVFYYIIPMSILAISNVIWIILTANRLRNLRRGNSILRRAAAEATDESMTSCIPSEHLQSALMYAKLLLSTGFAELTLEVLAWAFGRSTKQIQTAWRMITETEREYVYSCAAAVLDLIRALIVFWLSTGGLWNFRKTMGWIMQNLEFVSVRQKRRVGVSQETPSAAARGKKSELKLKDIRSIANKPKTDSF